jgi:glycerophosphoryl diester phosphodiesterase
MNLSTWKSTVYVSILIFSAYLLITFIFRSDSLNYASDNTRFIAHAGGQIEGHNYTNSLEALNLSYKKGFRMFELDIIKTSDNTFVAAHDWNKWKKITSFSGNIPPNREEFLRTRIYGKYTSMDISMINDWFKSHKDAVLVTDKINDPETFSAIFIDKERLIMELFSWNSVKVAREEGIKSAMPTGNLINQIKGDKIKFLKQRGITDIAISRNMLASNPELIQQINDSGIRIFAYNVNAKKGRGENYVICHERQYFYGIYANNWSQKYIPNCH